MVRELRLRFSAAQTGLLVVAAIIVFTMLASVTSQAQASNSYDKERILKVVRLNALSTREIVQAIQRRGVSFQMTSEIEAEFRNANAPSEVIEALRANYRPASAAPANPAGSSGRTPAHVPGGPPLGKNEIITLLQSGVTAARVERLVEVRGVDFQLNQEITREIMSAGGTRSLVGAISEKSTASSQPASSTGAYSGIGASMEERVIGGQTYIFIAATAQNSPAARAGLRRGDRVVEVEGQPVIGRGMSEVINMVRGPSGSPVTLAVERAATRRVETLRMMREITSTAAFPAGPDYDDLTDQATEAIAASLRTNDASAGNYAINVLQQALRLDASRPTAYQLLGYVQLYGFHNIFAAEQAMRAAIERGGSAVFYVYHDDGGVFSSYCEGSFFISKSSVSYKASNGSHAFEAEKAKIQEARINSLMGSNLAAFHLKVLLDTGQGKDKSKTYNFAPATRSKAESNLITNLIGSY